jgi:hypothetical protein
VTRVRLPHLVACVAASALAVAPAQESAQLPRWERGLPADPAHFPIAVWLHAPRNAARYRELGVNLYVGLWKGPTEAQLAELENAGMPVICDQNEFALTQLTRKVIVGWMHGDEPDNAQPLPDGQGYGPPIEPKRIVADYERIRAADPSRPVVLNLGQGVAWDGWHGRGVRSRHPEDYPEYVRGCDIASFDIYPVAHDAPAVTGKLEFVGRGVQRLRAWCGGSKPVFACIETTQIGPGGRSATPAEVRSEVWMALIHGARGIVYFVHEFKPKFVEAGLLAHPEMARAVQAINAEIAALAPALNSPDALDAATVKSSDERVPVALLCKRQGADTLLFAVAMGPGKADATFELKGGEGRAQVVVLGEARTLEAREGRFTDSFERYAVHLYRVRR